MTDKFWDAYYSKEALRKIGSYNIYKDIDGNLFCCTHVTSLGPGHRTGWTDMVYLGRVVEHVETVRGTIIRAGVRTAPIHSYNLAEDLVVNNLIAKGVGKAPSTTAKAINDFVCPACHNEKCSKTEKSCWKCGYQFVLVIKV